jgi:ParB family transcriptional regulator, chromosome partitioning protein
MAKMKGLGRGLDALLSNDDEAKAGDQLLSVRIEALKPGKYQPRTKMNQAALQELADSIKAQGLMQPVLVRRAGQDGKYEIIAGERRWRAAQRAGLHDVPVIIREVDDKEALELAIIENVQRVDLNPLEEAQGYEQLIEQFSYTQQDLAQVIGKSRSHVANTLRLLKLPADIRDMVNRGELTAGHARTLVTADDPAAVARQIVDRGLSVREAEKLAQGGGAKAKKPASEPQHRDADTLAIEKRLSDHLGLKVVIEHHETGGRVEIRYRTLEQLDTVLMRLTG